MNGYVLKCEARYDDVPANERSSTHTCDRPPHDRGPHHCPLCGNEWHEKRSHHKNHPWR